MRTLRASEIGLYLFCQRAWSYTKAGVESSNRAELAAGTELHQRHGQAVVGAGCLRFAAYLLLAAAVVAGVLWALEGWLGW
jgi:hypothetical protein